MSGESPAYAASGSLLSSLRQRLEAKQALIASAQQPGSTAGDEDAAQQGMQQEAEEADAVDPPRALGAAAQHADELLLVDLVSFDQCKELMQVPLHIEQQVLQQFSTSFLGLPLPSAARQQAEQLQRLPQESLGLYVAPHPRASSSSLYKMEQRLLRARQLDMQGIVQQLQEQFPAAQQAVEAAAAIKPGGLWLDENGLMQYEPNPAKASKQRPWRRYDQCDAVTATAWLPAVTAPLTLLDSRGVSYRLDVELGRLEFEVHPYMTLEHQLAAKLLCSFREYHRRAGLGLASFYGNKLAALEDGLLNAREVLFHVQDEGQGPEQVAAALAVVTAAEREVAELRQLKEEEESALLSALEAMAGLWQQLVDVRSRQGGLRLTDVGFSIMQLPQEETTPLQADGLTRQQLDIALLVAEADPIAGLPAHPAALPLCQADAELTSFGLRRVESTSSRHALIRAELTSRLALLQDRVSADPDDPESKSLQQQLEVLGPAPRRLPLTHQQEMELWNWAEEEVAAGRVGVYRPPRLQPCLTVLPAAAPGPRAAVRLGSTRGAADSSGTGTAAAAAAAGNTGSPGPRSRLSWPATSASKEQQPEGSPARTTGLEQQPAAAADAVVGLSTGQMLPVSQQGPKLPVKLSYYARLLVNERVVGTSEVVSLKEDYTLDFRDVFSLRLLKWPDSMQLQLWEQGTFRDTLVAQFYLLVPGLAGTPHVDPQAKPYSWTSNSPVPHQRLLQAQAALQPLGAVPSIDLGHLPQRGSAALGATAAGPGASASGQAGSSNQTAAIAGAPLSIAVDAGAEGHLAAGQSSISRPKGRSIAALYPSGRLYVRCGWVADTGVETHITPFEGSSSTAFATTLAKQAFHMTPGFNADDATVQISVAGRQAAAGQQFTVATAAAAGHGSSTAAKGRSGLLAGSSTSPHPSPERSQGKLGSVAAAAGGPDVVFGNPLAHIGQDVEVGPRLAPPLPHVKADRALQRAAIGGNKGHRSAASKWLAQELLDPNDPRNAALLELLRARNAAQSSGLGLGGSPDLFRLELSSDLLLAIDRAADQRLMFIKQRWQAGPYGGPTGTRGGGAPGSRQLTTVAPLSAKDTLELQDAYREALALVEAASLGLGSQGSGRSSALAVAAALNGRQDRALKWAQGVLAKAIEAREAGIRSFALRIRAACNQMGSGRGLGRHFKTDDVVKDAPLPEFKLDLSSLAAALAPARPLRPQRTAIKKLQACVPRDTQLVITLQRASNLPRRLGPGGGGVRQGSPNRTSGAHFSSNSRFLSRDRPLGVSYASSRGNYDSRDSQGFRSPGRATREGALPEWDEDSSTGAVAAGNSLSCFLEVKFRGNAQRTAAVDSDMPMWNEQVLFPVIGLGQEASPTALKESDGLITINLFDEVVTPTAAAKAARSAARAGQPGGLESLTEGPVLPGRERRFLGCLRVPLAAVYQAEVLAGAFKLDVPPVLLGYVQDSGRPPSLCLYITLQPRLAPPVELDEERVSGEQEDVARHARKWVSGISSLSQCRGRTIKALAVDPEGVGTLVPRYLAAAPLPPALAAQAAQLQLQASNTGSFQQQPDESVEQLMLSAARWVAHVPFVDDASFGKRRSNVWANNSDFVGMAAGDHEEHAHLLAGYFMELGQEALIVLGASMTGAQAVFVLTTGRALSAAAAAAAVSSDTTHSAAAAAVQAPAAGSRAAADQASADPSAAATATIDPQQQLQRQEQLRERLQQAAAAAQVQQQRATLNPAAEAAAAAAAALRPFDVAKLRMWNPLSGHCVPARDPACELREVGVIYSCDNIWANIQLSGHPWDISWNLADSGCWRPFFGPVLPAKEMSSVQVPPSYDELEPRVYEELEARVEETVRDALYEARSVVVTQPNNKLSRILKALLKEVPAQLAAINAASLAASLAMADVNLAGIAAPAAAEAARERLQQRLQLIQAMQLSHNDRVAREMRGCLINGHVLALPFSDGYADAVAEAVINTGLHRTVDPRVKFAMAAYVEPLGAAFVCCLWIYIAAIRETS